MDVSHESKDSESSIASDDCVENTETVPSVNTPIVVQQPPSGKFMESVMISSKKRRVFSPDSAEEPPSKKIVSSSNENNVPGSASPTTTGPDKEKRENQNKPEFNETQSTPSGSGSDGKKQTSEPGSSNDDESEKMVELDVVSNE
jgi:hypothetical protein